MKSIKQQYIDLKEGRMSQQNFMRNLRMTMPQYVTNVTSYGDAVKILRNKGILNESLIQQLEMGIGMEKKEHGMSEIEAAQIALDHLKEDPKYYTEESGEELEKSIAAADAAIEAGEEEDKPEYLKMRDFPGGTISEAKSKWENTSGKSMYAQFKEIDNLNGQEVLIGIDYEIEHNHELSKLDAIKLVIKNLKKNPVYYTATLMAGKEMTEIPTIGKLKPGSDKMRPVKGEDSLVDKDNGMKPVKDVEKVKASANKAKKETNKADGTISLMSLVAKASRGVEKMNATGEKMKVVKEGLDEVTIKKGPADTESKLINKVKEFIESDLKDYQNDIALLDQVPEKEVLLQFNSGEFLPDEAINILKEKYNVKKEEIPIGNTTVKIHYVLTPKISSVPSTIFSRNANLSTILPQLTKEDLMEMIREELEEALGAYGGDNVTDVAGHQLDEFNMDQFSFGSNQPSQPKASFEGTWTDIKDKKEFVDKFNIASNSPLQNIVSRAIGSNKNYAVTNEGGKFYVYVFTQTANPGKPSQPFNSLEDAKKSVKEIK